MSSANYLGWSKPIIELREIESFQADQTARFGNREVKVAEWSEDSVVLLFDNGKKNAEEDIERLELKPNTPKETGFDSGRFDGSRAYYLGCWTSWGRFLQYYYSVRLTRWIDDCKARIIDLPSHYSVGAIKRRWRFRRNRVKMKLDTLFHLDRPAGWRR